MQAQLEEEKADKELKAKEIDIKKFDAETKRISVENEAVRVDIDKLLNSTAPDPKMDAIADALEDLAEAANPKLPESVTITAPSGNVYQVQLNGGNDVD